MKKFAVLLFVPLLASCEGFQQFQTPEGQQLIAETVKKAAETATNVASGNWVGAITAGAAAVASTLGIVRAWRGSVHNRNGMAPRSP